MDSMRVVVAGSGSLLTGSLDVVGVSVCWRPPRSQSLSVPSGTWTVVAKASSLISRCCSHSSGRKRREGALERGQQLEQRVALLVGAAARGAGAVEDLADRRSRQAQAAQDADGGQGE